MLLFDMSMRLGAMNDGTAGTWYTVSHWVAVGATV